MRCFITTVFSVVFSKIVVLCLTSYDFSFPVIVRTASKRRQNPEGKHADAGQTKYLLFFFFFFTCACACVCVTVCFLVSAGGSLASNALSCKKGPEQIYIHKTKLTEVKFINYLMYHLFSDIFR